jgi:co-chaperonin GroES (HSP10)
MARMYPMDDNYLKEGWRAVKGPVESNTSGFRACGHRVLLSPEIVEETSAGGIVLVAKTVHAEKQQAVICTVLEIGHDCWTDKSTDYCQVGDRVLIGTYTGKFHTSPIDGKEYRFVMDTDIISPLPTSVQK